MVNFLYLGSCFSFAVLLLIFFKSKERIHSVENKLFEILMYVGISSIGCEMFLQYLVITYGLENTLMVIVSRLYLVSINLWFVIFSKYIFYIFKPEKEAVNFEDDNKKFIKRYSIINTVHNVGLFFCSILFLVLPIEYYKNGNIMYSYGMAVDLLRIVLILFMLLWAGISLKHVKKLFNVKYSPILAVFTLLILNIFIQSYDPTVLMFSFTFALLSYLMYFTIENPDVKMIEQLEIAKNAADKANMAKTDFLSSMSHEIRTPLNAIVGFSDCIMEAKDLKEAHDNARDVVNASQTLLEIVNGILDISKIEAGKLEIVNSTYNAQETFLELAKLITPKMHEKELDFSYTISEDLPKYLIGDYANIKKIVTNLLSNAYKYTDKGAVTYTVSCVNSGHTSKITIVVEDTGRGMKQDSLDKLFSKFQRLDEDKNTKIEGTGLGLAITKQLVELMNGKIMVQTVYGEGSRFTVVIDQEITSVDEEEVSTVSHDTLDLSTKKILVVDDNQLNIKVETKLLQSYNAKDVEGVDSGFSCIEKIKSGNKYDVILLDDMMPEMSGVETLHKLREIEGFNIPVVALTANAINGMKEKYLSEGFDDYLAKPLEKLELVKVLGKILGNSVVEEVKDNGSDKVIADEETPEVVNNDDSLSSSDMQEKFLRDKGVDMDNALGLLGDMEMYNETLNDYLGEIEDKLAELTKYKDESDMENYSILVHSMKSDAKYLGLMSFADIAYQHELKSKDNDIDFVNDNWQELVDELTKALDILKEYREKANNC